MRPTPPTEGITAEPIRPGEERSFHAIYRRHPGVGRFFAGSRRALEEAARVDVDRGYLLARQGDALVGALAVQREPGRRTAAWFPIASEPSSHRPICAALGDAARRWAADRGSVRLESEFRVTSASEALEPGLVAMGMNRITDRLLLRRPLEARSLPDDSALIDSRPEEAMGLLEDIYATSDDPAVASVPAADDLALFGADSGTPSHLVLMTPPEEEGPVGLCFLRQREGLGEIVFIGVAPGFRRQGYGVRLLLACLSRLLRMGAREVALAVSEQNRPALRLYERNGFRQAGRARLYRSSV